jgi:hypothetical protein
MDKPVGLEVHLKEEEKLEDGLVKRTLLLVVRFFLFVQSLKKLRTKLKILKG